MGEFIRTHSMARYDHDNERYLKLFRAGLSEEARSQINRMWNAQVNDVHGDWVKIYVRDIVTENLLAIFHVPLNVTATEHIEHVNREMTRLRNLYPLQADRMVTCHE